MYKPIWKWNINVFHIWIFVICNPEKIYARNKFYPTSFNTHTILNIIPQLIEDLYILHKFDIIHRDKKATNIMVKINSPMKTIK